MMETIIFQEKIISYLTNTSLFIYYLGQKSDPGEFELPSIPL